MERKTHIHLVNSDNPLFHQKPKPGADRMCVIGLLAFAGAMLGIALLAGYLMGIYRQAEAKQAYFPTERMERDYAVE